MPDDLRELHDRAHALLRAGQIRAYTVRLDRHGRPYLVTEPNAARSADDLPALPSAPRPESADR